MSQVEYQNVHQGGLFKTFDEMKPEINSEQVNSSSKAHSTNHLPSDIMSTSFNNVDYVTPYSPFLNPTSSEES